MWKKIKPFLKKKLIKESMWSILTKGITMLLFLVFNIYLARTLGVELFGNWSYFFSILTIIFTIGFLGINTSSRSFIGKERDSEELSNILLASILVRTISSVIILIVLVFLMPYITELIGETENIMFFMVSIIFIFFRTFLDYFKFVFQGLHRLKYLFVINMIEFSSYLIFVYILLKQGLYLEHILYSFIIASLLAVVFGTCVFFKFFNFKKIDKESLKKYMRSIYKYSFPLLILSLGFIIMTEIDTFMIGYLLNNNEVGLYSAAKQIINKLPHIALTISMGVLPIFANITKDNVDKLKNLFNKILLINIYIYLPICFIFIVFAGFIINIMYGIEYLAASPIMQILSVGAIIGSLNIYFTGFLNYQMKARRRAFYFSITIILNIILNIVLIPKLGGVGAALATTISAMPYILLNYLEVKSIFKTF